MKKSLLLFSIILFFGIISCDSNRHFISDKSYREKVEIQFEKQKELAKNRAEQLFGVFNEKLSTEETEALKFLYAYMPLSDLADYDGAFYLKNIQSSFEARELFSWGDQVPENLFRHFVLPVRVNNETMDTARIYFLQELKDRVKQLSMKEAVLEVNHWCHEKVVYKSTDSRTSGPLNTIKSAFGRCGEESTFTTAALRAIGIPARQCYTPRWAHSDDNHAWVEVWVDGKWHFIGACEPESDLDLAWFTGPAKRAMLVNTTVYGDYAGDEEVLEKTDWFTKINILSNYTETKLVYVKVVDEKGIAISQANVDFCLYNYAEFFPLSKRKTDEQGMASFLTGKGDLMIYVSDGKAFKYAKLDVRTTDTLVVCPNQKLSDELSLQFDLIAPKEVQLSHQTDEKAQQQNAYLLNKEDSIRRIYTASFLDSSRAAQKALELNLSLDSVRHCLEKSCGNHETILSFLQIKEGPSHLKLAYLYSLSEKDLRDISLDVLTSHYLLAEQGNYSITDFVNYIMNPRVGIEMAGLYKKEIKSSFQPQQIKQFQSEPAELAKWVTKEIGLKDSVNYYKISITPLGVHQLKWADKASRNAYFVAVCRSLGIAARIETASKKPQYLKNGIWMNAIIGEQEQSIQTIPDLVEITLTHHAKQKGFVPSYATHYSLAIFENGRYKTLDYEENAMMSEFPVQLKVQEGSFLLVTGVRQTNGSVLNSMRFFEVRKGKQIELDVHPRHLEDVPTIYGKMDMNTSIEFYKNERTSLKNAAKEKGVVMIWLGPEKEPTKHVLVELKPVKSKLESWGGGFVLVADQEQKVSLFQAKKYPGIPLQNKMAIDTDYQLLNEVLKSCGKSLPLEFPVLVYVNIKGEVQYFSNGYQIGNVEMLEKAVQKDLECQKSCAIPQ
ncbi:MAG: transglutaminase-like domain-containing protein [Bacteroidia bacterium]